MKILGIAGLLFGGAVAYSYYKKQSGNQTASLDVSTASGAVLVTENSSQVVTKSGGVTPATPNIVTGRVVSSAKGLSSLASVSPFKALNTGILFQTSRFQKL